MVFDKEPGAIELKGRALDLRERIFGRLTALKPVGRCGGKIVWWCLCACGSYTEVSASNLISGNTSSCGCYHSDKAREANTKGGNKYVVVGDSAGLILTGRSGCVRGLAIVDREDLALVCYTRWCLKKDSGYVTNRHGDRLSRVVMAEELSGKEHLFVDHIDHDLLNNRRENLRVCTNAQNSRNSKLSKCNKTGYKGVYCLNRRSFRARIVVDYKTIHLGYFSNAGDAAKAYNEAALKYFGEFACLNIIR
jgi:hypothetical protein